MLCTGKTMPGLSPGGEVTPMTSTLRLGRRSLIVLARLVRAKTVMRELPASVAGIRTDGSRLRLLHHDRHMPQLRHEPGDDDAEQAAQNDLADTAQPQLSAGHSGMLA